MAQFGFGLDINETMEIASNQTGDLQRPQFFGTHRQANTASQ